MGRPIEDFNQRLRDKRDFVLGLVLDNGDVVGAPLREEDGSQSHFDLSQVWKMDWIGFFVILVYLPTFDLLFASLVVDTVHIREIGRKLNA